MDTTYQSNWREFLVYLSRNRKMAKALLRASDEVLKKTTPPKAVTLELYLCCLHNMFGDSFLRQIDNRREFLKMRNELLPNGYITPFERWWRRRQLSPPEGEGILVPNEQRLSRILWNAFRIARASEARSSSGLPEFMAALCLDEEATQYLKKCRGFIPANYLDPTFPVNGAGTGGNETNS
jgi:hypothetical protein